MDRVKAAAGRKAEPRHFGALSRFGTIVPDIDGDTPAPLILRRLAPHIGDAQHIGRAGRAKRHAGDDRKNIGGSQSFALLTIGDKSGRSFFEIVIFESWKSSLLYLGGTRNTGFSCGDCRETKSMSPHEFEVIEFKNRSGSVEHFYHYFFGVLIPFINYLAASDKKNLYFLRSCGPMNRHWLELNLDNIILVDKLSMARLAEIYGCKTLEGFDDPQFYDHGVFLRSRDFLINKFSAGCAVAGLGNVGPGSIVIVERGNGDPYYNSSLSEIKTNANERRSIPNLPEIAAAVRNLSDAVVVHQLESASLEKQAKIFSKAEVVIAQHGAALANIFWMKPGAKVIEILPPQKVHMKSYFVELSKIYDVRHEIILQGSEHAEVDVGAVVAAIKAP